MPLYVGVVPKTPTPHAADDHDIDKPLGGSRLLATLAVLAMACLVLVVLWLSLTSRGFAAVDGAADGARIVVRGVEDTLDTDLVGRSDVPWERDEIAHLVGWGGVMVVVGLLLHTRRSLSDLAVGVFAASISIEFMQKLLTATRKLEAEDISANALGVMVGLMFLVALERLVPLRSARP